MKMGPEALLLAAQRVGYNRASAQALVTELEHLAETPDEPDDAADMQRVEELWKITSRP
jgi:hypothetical protein